jgi:TonB family protein
MIKPRFIITSSFAAAVLLYACLSPSGLSADARAQQSTAMIDDRVRGISLYKEGKDQEAIVALRQAVKRYKNDVSAWHYLGLALSRQGKASDALKAHEKAAKLGEKLLDSIIDIAPYEEFSVRVKPYRLLLIEAADSAEKYLELSSRPSKSKVEEWDGRAEFLRAYVRQTATDEMGENVAFKVYAPAQVTTKARILSRTEPEYTDEARQHLVSGTIVLRGVFAFDGKVRGLRVMSGLPYGLTSRAIKAARKIKFVPATINGQPVSQYIQIEYNFNLY